MTHGGEISKPYSKFDIVTVQFRIVIFVTKGNNSFGYEHWIILAMLHAQKTPEAFIISLRAESRTESLLRFFLSLPLRLLHFCVDGRAC